MHSNQLVGVAGCVAATMLASAASADLITEFAPSDAPHVNSPPFGPVAPGGVITTEYAGFGVDFTSFNGSPDVAVFDDPPGHHRHDPDRGRAPAER
jgi:hypothetical protein